MRCLNLALAATCLSLATPAFAGPTEDFHALMDEYWATVLKDAPVFATQTGVTTYDRELGVVTLAEFDRQLGLEGGSWAFLIACAILLPWAALDALGWNVSLSPIDVIAVLAASLIGGSFVAPATYSV